LLVIIASCGLMRPAVSGAQGIVLLSFPAPPVYPHEVAQESRCISGCQRIVTANRGIDPGRRRPQGLRMVAIA